ncbi:hypothetical protein COB11_00220 [Candidatus Aerophobetes bacterium]|uniref:Yip1 domain-containing protein n=1 Tax=Aerophobetes bacterium TaxID=2030807 RepID=A0A2A4YMV3_UNCAE|nr:MAG: hypothetical protein COB11_00220 [Candidatus Aerophobetes bacterium]
MNQKLEENPWWSMWVKPKETIRNIINYNHSYCFIWLCLLYGFIESVHIAQGLSLGGYLPMWITLLISIALAIPVGAISFSLTSLFVYWTGKLIKATGTYKEIRASVAWSNVTTMFSVILVAILIVTFGNAVFFRNFYEASFSSAKAIVLILILVVEVVLAIWRLVIFIKSLAEVQGCSGWMAFLNVILASVLASILYFSIILCLSFVGKASFMQ